MPTAFQKLILSIICGAALAAPGCVRSCNDEPSGPRGTGEPARPPEILEPSKPPRGVEPEPSGKDLPPVSEKEESEDVDVYGPPRK